MGWWLRLCWSLLVVIMLEGGHADGREVTYDGRSLIINGQRQILLSGSIHYPRSTPQFYMQNFTTKIVNLMKSEGLYASQGGPIILSQIENEYQNIEPAFHEKGPPYVLWAAKMAVGLQTGVPWVMCKQQDAPDPVEPIIRSAEDIAFHVALFIARNGSFVNYYMYHGGTNFGRTSSSYVVTAYYDQAPLDEYGEQPKWGHLKELHAVIKLCSTTLLQGTQTKFPLGTQQEAIVFEENTGGCSAFLINNDTNNNAIVQFRKTSFQLPPKSISILPDCKKVTFNTAMVNIKFNNRITTPVQTFDSANYWKEFNDVIVNFRDTSLKSNGLLEQTSTTKDKSDYLWYTLSFQPNSPCSNPILHVESSAHVAHAFLNNIFVGSANGRFREGFKLDIPIQLNNGMNNISILSVMVGLQVGLLGEDLKTYEEGNLGNVVWNNGISPNQRFTWYKVTLNLSSMGKGETWVNGQSIGRYWSSYLDEKGNPSQIMYHVPRSFLKPSGNLLVLLEETVGNPLQISLNTVSITNV
ncbi:hypothetical protein CMV_021383 [Castanea mollissima]|uniref:beta-galactosidase n=1 Tax=Castanea mollissima TaxID=60419 RepID=A0A8J4V993_9ROSI|nr:hypothetical protein CMV_021383 [Castanea mollissima]